MNRVVWEDLPEATREAVNKCTGGEVTAAQSAEHGVRSSFASLLTTDHRRVFVKGCPLTDPGAWSYEHEFNVTACAPLAPQALFTAEAGGWRMFGYQYLSGRHPTFAPSSPDLPGLVETLTVLSAASWPTEVGKKPLASRLSSYVSAEDLAALEGRTLVHCDLGDHNLLATGPGPLRVLDWAMSVPGPAWADTALLVPRLIAAGHTVAQAEEVAARVPAYAGTDRVAVAVLASGTERLWTALAKGHPQQAHRAALIGAMRDWLGSLPAR